MKTSLEPEILYLRNEYLDVCFKLLGETLTRKDEFGESMFRQRCMRCLRLITKMLEKTEKYGTSKCKSHSQLVQGQVLRLTIKDRYNSSFYTKPDFEVVPYSNSTVFELYTQVAHHFQVPQKRIVLHLFESRKEINDAQNGMTLHELGLNNNDELSFTEESFPKANLMQDKYTLNPRAQKIFPKWFNVYSDNGNMSLEQCASFIYACTNENCGVDDRRVQEIFTAYDDDRDGFLTRDNFFTLYLAACQKKSDVVWQNLETFHESKYLKETRRVKPKKVNVNLLARHIISSHNEYFELLYSLLDCEDYIAVKALDQLDRLPTNPQTFADTVMLKGIRGITNQNERNWSCIFDINTKYKLLYALKLVEYLIVSTSLSQDNSQEQESLHELWSQNATLLEYGET